MQAEEDPVDVSAPSATPRGNHRDQLRARRAKLPRVQFVVGRRTRQQRDNGQNAAPGLPLPHRLLRAARHRTAATFRATDTLTSRRQVVRLSAATCPRVAQYDREDRDRASLLRLQPVQSRQRKQTAVGTIHVLARTADRSSNRSPIAMFDVVHALRSKA